MLDSDRGLVLRVIPLRETSQIVSILGRQHGKLRLVARGVRAPGSRAGASLQSGNEVEFVFTLRPGRELGNLREASLHRGWLGGLRRLEPLAVGWAALELLERVVPDGAMEEGLLDDAWCYLEALQSAPDRGAAVLLFYAFELRLLERLGLRPGLDTCRACGGRPSGTVTLDLAEASWACGRCRPPGSSGWNLPEETVGVLRSLQAEPWGAGDLHAAVRTRRSVGVVLHRLLGMHLERYRYPHALRLLRRSDPQSPKPDTSKPDHSGFGAGSERPRD